MSVILPSVFKDGTASVANGSTSVDGQSLIWTQNVLPGDFFGVHKGYAIRIASVDSDTHLTLANPWPGATQTTAAYEIMLQSDNARVQETTRQLLERMQSGNLYALAGLSGVTDNLPIFTGPGAMGLISKSDLVTGVAYDVQVPNMAGRAAYDANAQGFSVLVSDVGDGRAALYTKKSNTVADWSAPAYITGPIGPMPTVNVGTTSTLTPGSAATVARNVVTGGYTFDFGIPAGKGFNPRGAYAGGTAYVLGDVVTNAGSSWVALVATTGNAPPTLPTASNTWWTLVASKGTDGTGIGDMVKSVYDPTGLNVSAFVRGNFTGDQPDSVLMANAASPTKKAKFDLSGITAGQTRNIIVPDGDTALSKWELINDAVLSGSSQAVFTNLGAFVKLRLSGYLYRTVGDVAAGIAAQVSTDNGATWAGGSSDYGYLVMSTDGNLGMQTSGGASTVFPLSAGLSVDNTSVSSGIDFECMMNAFNKSQYLRFRSTFNFVYSSAFHTGLISGSRAATVARNALRVLVGSGTITGWITLEGIRG
jgi:hypothetical protein